MYISQDLINCCGFFFFQAKTNTIRWPAMSCQPCLPTIMNHRTVEQPRLDFKDHLVQPFNKLFLICTFCKGVLLEGSLVIF